MKKKSSNGFTIVELLIVIVVIGILAAITIAAFNGVQQRANNSQRISAAKQYQKLFLNYLTTNSRYPANTFHPTTGVGTDGKCLGYNYPTDWGSATGGCFMNPSAPKIQDNTYNTELATVGSLPEFNKKIITVGSVEYLGITIRANEAVDGVTYHPTLRYWLEGTNQDCVLRPVATVVSAGVYSTTANPSATYTVNQGTVATQCVIALPNPTTL